MRILIVSSEGPPIVSGISRCVAHLATGLRDRGHEVDVLSSVTMKRLVLGEFRLSSFVVHWPRIARSLSYYDVINLHGPVPTLSDAFLVLASWEHSSRQRPIVYTHHSAIEIAGWERASDLYNVFHKWLAKRATVTLTTSQFYCDTMFSPSRHLARLVPWGVDPVDPGSHTTQAGSPLRVLFVGQMRPYKGVNVLLDAVAGYSELAVTLVGSGPELAHYEAFARDRGADNVKFVGRVSDEDLGNHYRDHDVVVLPSLTRAEAFGLVVLEGMANGDVPVVSDLPGVRDLAQGPGVVVPPNDAGALRDALLSLARNRTELSGRRRAALQRAHELSWDACVDSYESIMRELVPSPTEPPKQLDAPNDHASKRRVLSGLRTRVRVEPVEDQPSRVSRMRRFAAALLLLPWLLVACAPWDTPWVIPSGSATDEAGNADAPVVGTLLSSPERDELTAAAGLTGAMIELEWRRAEPADGQFDRSYLMGMAHDIRDIRDSGRSVTLGLGLHYTPAWAFTLPNSRYVNQRGDVADQLNFVFNEGVRETAERYLEVLDEVIGFENVDSVRFTSGGSAEVLYPGDGSYWAFDANAMGGDDLPSTYSPNPLLDWRPGNPSMDIDVTRGWADWYIGALVDVVEWQREVLRGLGFSGYEQILTPGLGARPHQYDEAIEKGLPDGLVGVGAVWARFYASLKRTPTLVAYSTSVADGSGDNSDCDESDGDLDLAAAGREHWSAIRWVTRIAHEHGLLVAGENPGFGLPSSLNESYLDSTESGMMASAFRLVHSCDLHAFYWAHEGDLRNGTASAEQFVRLARATTKSEGWD